ncbi:hypothetical protein [Mesorhizobium sp. f-mel]
MPDQPVDARALQFECDRPEQRPLADSEPHRFDMEGSLGVSSCHGLGLPPALCVHLEIRLSAIPVFGADARLTMKHEFNSQQW